MLSSHALESKLKDPSKEEKDRPPSTRTFASPRPSKRIPLDNQDSASISNYSKTDFRDV